MRIVRIFPGFVLAVVVFPSFSSSTATSIIKAVRFGKLVVGTGQVLKNATV